MSKRDFLRDFREVHRARIFVDCEKIQIRPIRDNNALTFLHANAQCVFSPGGNRFRGKRLLGFAVLSGDRQSRYLTVLVFENQPRSTWTTIHNNFHLSLSLCVIIHVIGIGSIIRVPVVIAITLFRQRTSLLQ